MTDHVSKLAKGKKMKTLIEALLEYQDKKNELVKGPTKEDLIPHVVRLTEKDFRKKGVIDRIKRNFMKSHQLTDGNCLHCIVFEDDCNVCPYHMILDDGCRGENSLYRRINKIWETVKDGDSGDKLEDLGDTLEDILYLY